MHTRHLAAAATLALAIAGLAAPAAHAAATRTAAAPAAAVAPAPTRASALTVVASQSARVAKVNAKVTVSAKITPAKGAYAKVQVRQQGTWRSVMRSVPVAADGTFRASIWGTGPGTYTVRVYAAAGKDVGVSKAMALRVVR